MSTFTSVMPSPHRHLSVDELSHRASTGLAIRRGDIKISDPIPSSYVHNGPSMDFDHDPVILADNDASASLSGKNGPGAFHGRSGSAPLSSHPAHISKFTERTTSLGPPISTTNMISLPTKEPESQKRDGGLRASIKRMFSKKSHATTIQKRGAYHSDPGRLLTTAESHDRPYFQSSVQYNTVTLGHPLNSHATSPHLRVRMVENNTSQASDVGQLGKRRNTLPILSSDTPNEPEDVQQGQPDPPQERVATQRPSTSTLQVAGSTQYLNRRSKSAGALTDLVLTPKSKPSGRRDRSEEIAFWRNSIVNAPLPQMPSIESMRSLNSFRGERSLEDALSKRPRPSIEPVQDFDFGLNNGSGAVRSSTLQERVNTLEVKLFDFEYALAKLQGNDLTKPALPQKPSRRRSTRSAIPESRGSSSSTNDTSYLSSPDEKWSSPVLRQQPHHKHDRASKATTIKPIHTRRPSSRSQASSPSIHITRSQYDALRTLIDDEKAARHQLEMQMINLQQQVENLRTPVHAYIRPVQYPTPSPDSSFQNHSARVPSKAIRRSPIFQENKTLNETSRFSMSETDPETELDTDDRNYASKGSPEVFETPQESTFRFDPRTISPSGMF